MVLQSLKIRLYITFKESEKTADSGKIAAYKITLLVGMFLCVIGGWIYLCWLGVPARYGSIILLLLGIMTLLFAEIACDLTETEVTYRLGTAGKTLKLKAENSSSIVGNS